MGKKKTQTTNTYGYVPHQDTADQVALRNTVAKGADFHSGVNAAYGQAENEIGDQKFEEALPDGVKERIKLGQMFNLDQNKAIALGNAAAQEHQANVGGQATVAGMTANPFVQTGGTQTSSGGVLEGLLNSSINAAGAVGGGFAA